MNAWIDVKDALPRGGYPVLFFKTFPRIGWIRNDRTWVDQNTRQVFDNVTFWQSLPQEPKPQPPFTYKETKWPFRECAYIEFQEHSIPVDRVWGATFCRWLNRMVGKGTLKIE